jgi:branched-chain amino acid transport system ATP-binding protein
MTEDIAILEANNIKVHFGGVRALDGINLRLASGRLYGLVGPNGSGKSTFINAISRIVNLSSGELKFNGRQFDLLPPYLATDLGIARTFQAVRLSSSLTVLENVMAGADAHCFGRNIFAAWLLPLFGRRSENQVEERARNALSRLGLTGCEGENPASLPYGIQRRVEIARALAADPQLLLLDEPTAGMSQSERMEIAEILTTLSKDGLTQVLVEHDVGLISAVCDYVYVLDFGKLIAEGAPDDVVRNPAVQEAYLGKELDE